MKTYFSQFLDQIHAMPYFNEITNPQNPASPLKDVIEAVLFYQNAEKDLKARIDNLQEFL